MEEVKILSYFVKKKKKTISTMAIKCRFNFPCTFKCKIGFKNLSTS